MIRLVLLRHGESVWNRENRFTGWTDVDLSDKGIIEARKAGQILKEQGYSFDVAFTSVLKRAIRTLWIVLDEMGLMWIPVHISWRLNERHYGALQGLNKAEMAAKYGEGQVLKWRRSYDIRPPALEKSDPTMADVVPIGDEYVIYRDCGIALTHQGKAKALARSFMEFLESAETAKIF